MSSTDPTRLAVFAVIGAIFGFHGVYDNVLKGEEEFDLVHLATTITTHVGSGAAAGVALGIQGEGLDDAALASMAVPFAHVIDKKVNPHVERALYGLVGSEPIYLRSGDDSDDTDDDSRDTSAEKPLTEPRE